MKPFVSSHPDAVRWKKEGSPRQSSGPGGRFRWLPDLWNLVLPIVGAVILAEFLGLIETGELVKFMLAGPTFGAVIGRSIVVWRERGRNELPPERVRQIEGAWVLIGAVVSLLLYLLS